MKRLTLSALPGLLLATLAVAALAVEDVPPRAGWHEARVTLLDATFGESGFHARWEYLRCDCGDVLVRVEQSAPDGVLTGELLLVDGQVIAARGPVSQSHDLELMLQAPTLMLHVAFGLLQRAEPEGPAAVRERRELELAEARQGLQVHSGLSTGEFGAPWSVAGRVWPSGAGQRRFELDFEFEVPGAGEAGGRERIRFSGGQDYLREGFPLEDATSLAGWRVQWISRGEKASKPAPDELTLGELRTEALTLSEPQAARGSETIGEGLHDARGQAHGSADRDRQVEGA